MKKVISLLMMVVMLTFIATSCGSPAETTAPAEGGTTTGGESGDAYDLIVWVYSDMVTNEQGALTAQWVEEFVAEHDNVNSIELVAKNDSDLLTSLMAGVGLPDAFCASARNGKQFREVMPVMDLTEMYESDADYTAGFYPSAIDAITVDGGMWAVPFISYIPIIYRNLTVIEAAGIDPADGIPTYDAFVEQLAMVEASGVDATHSWANGGFFPTGAIMASDAETITEGVTDDGMTTIEPTQLVRTFETMLRVEEYANAMTYGQDVTHEAFKTDQIGFIVDGPWIEPGIQQSGVNYDVVAVPAHEDGGWTGGMQGWDFFYGVETDDEVRNGLVMEFLKKMGSYESEKAWTMNVGRSTLRQDVMDDPEVISNTMMGAVTSEALKMGMNQMDFMHTSVFWASPMGDVAPMVANGDLTPEEGAQELVDKINGLYAESGEFGG